MAADFPVPDCTGVRVVASFAELAATPLADGVHAVVWPRRLEGDFGAVLRHVVSPAPVRSLDEHELRSLQLGPAGRAAVDCLLADLQRIRSSGHAPSIECVSGYERDAPDAVVATDVFSFHVDSAPIPTETWLCSYTEPASEGLCRERARRRVDVPSIRARLLALWGGADDAGFAAWLSEHRYDLHYEPVDGAEPFSFGVGNLWRLAVQFPECPVPAAIHRAPFTAPGVARLLLIS